MTIVIILLLDGLPRKIVHIDMDAFYASVEQRDDPQLRGKPVNYVPNQARKAEVEYAMSNSFGFGGTNGALLFGRWTE